MHDMILELEGPKTIAGIVMQGHPVLAISIALPSNLPSNLPHNLENTIIGTNDRERSKKYHVLEFEINPLPIF